MTPRVARVAWSVAIALVIAVGALGAQAAPARAADGWTETGATTYELDPDHGVLHVSVTLHIANQTAGTYLSYTRIWVENEATGIAATSDGAALSATPGSKGDYYRLVTVDLPRVYAGETRTVLVTYEVPGGAPRTSTYLRLLRAYADFCVIEHGYDTGTVEVRVPSGYTFDISGSPLESHLGGGERIYTSGSISDPSSFSSCLTGTNEAGYKVDAMTAVGGRQVQVMSWPEDTAWAVDIGTELASSLPSLAKLIGRPMPTTTPLVVKEAVTGTEYAGFYDTDTNTVTVGEDFQQAALVPHELAHVWFNDSSFIDRWLNEGSAEWAGRTASGEEAACERPSAGDVATHLASWTYLTQQSTQAERDAVQAEYDTACYVVTAVADASAPNGMTAALGALLDRRDPYAADPAAHRSAVVATWKEWLDAVDELALAPAGATPNLASDLLLAYGVTTDRTLLTQREAARAAYHRLAASVGDWIVPAAVRRPLAAWDFMAAAGAISAATAAWDITGEADAVLPGIDARHGPAAAAWASAMTTDDLANADRLAQAQLDAAKDVAGAIALAKTPLDTVQQAGLLGTEIPSMDPAVAAVRAGDAATATRIAASVRSAIGALRDAGQLRIAAVGALAVVLLLIVALLLVRARRRRRTRTIAEAMAEAAPAAASPDAAAASPDAAAASPDAEPAPSWPQPPPPPRPPGA